MCFFLSCCEAFGITTWINNSPNVARVAAQSGQLAELRLDTFSSLDAQACVLQRRKNNNNNNNKNKKTFYQQFQDASSISSSQNQFSNTPGYYRGHDKRLALHHTVTVNFHTELIMYCFFLFIKKPINSCLFFFKATVVIRRNNNQSNQKKRINEDQTTFLV